MVMCFQSTLVYFIAKFDTAMEFGHKFSQLTLTARQDCQIKDRKCHQNGQCHHCACRGHVRWGLTSEFHEMILMTCKNSKYPILKCLVNSQNIVETSIQVFHFIHYTTLTDFSTIYLAICRVYTVVGGIQYFDHSCLPVREVIHAL